MWLLLVLAATALTADESPGVVQARQELERVRQQADAGLVPAMKVAEAERAVDDATDLDVLDGTLYAHLAVEDLNLQQAQDMVAAAERRVARIEEKVSRGKMLVEQGVAEPYLFADTETELASRKQVLEQARARAALVMEIVEIARAETTPDPQPEAELKPREHFEGEHLLETKDVREITLAFEKQFHEPFPVSARGSTAVHRALGFDHTGRIDVAIAPDSAEGVWLRKFLEAKSIPYYAFRVAIPGKATAPHIHIGPGSSRIPTD
jgi:hypothetical protein